MSTVMGQVDKEPIRLVIVLINQSSNPRCYDYTSKLRKIVNCVGSKFAELFLSIREDFEFRGFEIAHYYSSMNDFKKTILQIRRNKPDIFLNFFVGKFSQFASSNKEFSNIFMVPERFMRQLPVDYNKELEWSTETRETVSELMIHLIHEISHSLGALHSKDGVMQPTADYLPSDALSIRNMKLCNLFDRKSITIICESMSIITTLKPQRDLKYSEGELTYTSDQSIAAVFFAKDTHYTDVYEEFTFLDACKFYKVQVPEEWDRFVVVHFCGHIYHYVREHVETTKICSRTIEF